MPEPSELLDRFREATVESAAVAFRLSELASVRSGVLAELHGLGWSYGRMAGAVGLSRSQIQQLVERGKTQVTFPAGASEV